jgi:hypothetical protein
VSLKCKAVRLTAETELVKCMKATASMHKMRKVMKSTLFVFYFTFNYLAS